MSNDQQSIQKTFNEYQIILTSNMDYVNILIQNNNTSNIYESKFNIKDFHQHKLLAGNSTIDEMIEFISDLIDEQKIKIEEKENNLKFNLISTIKKYPNVDLILNKKNILERLINEIEEIKNENKRLKNKIELIEVDNKKLNIRIDLIEKEKDELKNKIETIINLNKIDNEENITKIVSPKKNNKDLNNKIEKDNEINEIKKKIKILEGYHKHKYKIQLTKCNFKNIRSIETHKDYIKCISIFPSGNIISVSSDKSIIIYDNNLNILQNIQNAHNEVINYVEVKDENNFITCGMGKNIKLWIKKENKFIINKIINDAHEDCINKVIYYLNENFISCSSDKKIKIWKEIDKNSYDNIKILTHSSEIWSLLYLEDKNILISSGYDGTKFWNLNKNENNYDNIKCIKSFKDVDSTWSNGICRLDEDRIIVGHISLKIISILNKIIIKEIKIPLTFRCWGIKLIENKGIFLINGKSKDIIIYRYDNYECIQIIQNAHDGYINGFVELKDESIISYSWDKKIKIWN